MLANVVETYIQLEGEDVERFEAKLTREDTNKEVKQMELTWEEALKAGKPRERPEGRPEGRPEVRPEP